MFQKALLMDLRHWKIVSLVINVPTYMIRFPNQGNLLNDLLVVQIWHKKSLVDITRENNLTIKKKIIYMSNT